jgi:hypothetical protein
MDNDIEARKKWIKETIEENRKHLKILVDDKEHILQNILSICEISNLLNKYVIQIQTLEDLNEPMIIHYGYVW